MSMYEGVMANAKNQLATEQQQTKSMEIEREKVLAGKQGKAMPSHYRQQVTSTVFEVAAFWAKQNNTLPAESDLTTLAKSLMAVISVVESDQ